MDRIIILIVIALNQSRNYSFDISMKCSVICEKNIFHDVKNFLALSA